MRKSSAHPPAHPFARLAAPAFNLIEVMFSILILGVGLVAVAGLFPIAGSIQRATVEDVTAAQISRNAQSAIKGRGFGGPGGTDLMPEVSVAPNTRFNPMIGDTVQPLPIKILAWDVSPGYYGQSVPPQLAAQVHWLLTERCYPSATGLLVPFDRSKLPMQGTPAPADQPYYWVPLIRIPNLAISQNLTATIPVVIDADIFVFVLKKEQGVTYANPYGGVDANDPDPNTIPHVKSIAVVPAGKSAVIPASTGVARVSQLFDIGDWVLDTGGTIHRINRVDDATRTISVGEPFPTGATTDLWYGVRGSSSPTRRIDQFKNKVVLPPLGNLPPPLGNGNGNGGGS